MTRQPMRLLFNTTGLVSDAQYEDNARVNFANGAKGLEMQEPHDTPLAIVGGGPSARRHLDELKSWPGHIWAINMGAAWLAREGTSAKVWLFTVDPDPVLGDAEWVTGVERAILGACVSPRLVAALDGKDVRFFNPQEAPIDPESLEGDQVLAGGPSSVCRTFVPAAILGYKDVTYFGCEGSIAGRFDADGMFLPETHAYRMEHRPRQMIVRCGAQDFVTTPDLYLSTIALARFMREYPMIKEKSGGLLRGMLDHPDTWEVIAVSEAMRAVLPTQTERWGAEKFAQVQC